VVTLVGSAFMWLLDLTQRGEWRGLFFALGAALALAVTVAFWTAVVLTFKLRSPNWPTV
jgi:hypothetical protein